MSQSNHESSEWDAHHLYELPRSMRETAAPSLLPNVVTGIVTSRTEGLTRTAYRIRIGQRTEVRMRWPCSSPSRRTLEIGQTVRLTIPQEAVQLEAGGFRRGKQRWNRWIGRVVLTAQEDEDCSLTVKIHQDIITLKSRAQMIGAQVPLTTWDTVNIVIDPQRIKVCSCALASAEEPPPRRTPSIAAGCQAFVWLRTIVRCVRSIPSGLHLTLSAGGATLAALIETGVSATGAWRIGDSIEVTIGSGDTWIRKDAHSPTLPCCIVLSTEFTDAPRLRSAQGQNQ